MPLFGTRRPARVEANAAAARLDLEPAELARLDEALPPGAAAGSALPEFMEGLGET